MLDEAPARDGDPTDPTGHKSLIVGIANDQSIAYGCAEAFRASGAELAITWLNDKARPYVEPLGEALGAEIMAPLNVENPGELEALFDEIRHRWGKLDSLIHSIAFAPKEDLQGGLPLFGSGLCAGDGCFLSLVRTDGEANGAAHDGWGNHVRHELSGREQGRHQLQRDGACESSAGGGVPLPRL